MAHGHVQEAGDHIVLTLGALEPQNEGLSRYVRIDHVAVPESLQQLLLPHLRAVEAPTAAYSAQDWGTTTIISEYHKEAVW